DFFNHSTSNSNAEVVFPETGGIVVLARNRIDPHQELLIQYGQHSNRTLLLHYGFTEIRPPSITSQTISFYPSEQDMVTFDLNQLKQIIKEWSSYEACRRHSFWDKFDKMKWTGLIHDRTEFAFQWPPDILNKE